MYKQNLALKYLQWLTYHKTQPNQTKSERQQENKTDQRQNKENKNRKTK